MATTLPNGQPNAAVVPDEDQALAQQTGVSPLQTAGIQQPTANTQQAIPTEGVPAVDPNQATVEGRLANMTAAPSKLQQVAQTNATQLANQRGLMNTSLAVGAAQKANIESALPIAQQDAGFFQKQALMKQQEDIDKRLQTAGADEQLRLIMQKGEIDKEMQQISGQQAVEQIKTKGQIETELVQQQHLNNQEILTAQEGMESRLTAQRAEISQQLLTAEGEQKSVLLAQQGKIDYEMALTNAGISKDLQQQLFEINSDLEVLRADLAAEDLDQRAANEQALVELKGTIETRLQELVGSQALAEQGLKGEQAAELSALELEHDMLIKTQYSASAVFTETSGNISSILANPDIPSSSKSGLIKQQMALLKLSLNAIGGLADVDLNHIMLFGS